MKKNKLIYPLLMTLISTSGLAEDFVTAEVAAEVSGDICTEADLSKLSVSDLRAYAPDLIVDVKDNKIVIDYGKASSCLQKIKIKYDKDSKNNVVLTFPKSESFKTCVDQERKTSYKPIYIDLGRLAIDKSQDSRVLINSPEESGSAYSLPQNVYGLPKNGCGSYETPKKNEWIMANRTDVFDLYYKTVQLCEQEDGKLSDYTEHLNKLVEGSGNLTTLIEATSNLQKDLLTKEMKTMLEEISDIEKSIAPSADDEDFGLGKSDLKEAIDKYGDIMEKFTSEIMPSIEARLKILEEKRKVAKDEKDKKLLKEIDREVRGLNELVAEFDRENSDHIDEFEIVVDAMAEYNLQSSGKKVFTAVKNAEFLKRVYFEEEDDLDRGDAITLEQAKNKAKTAMKKEQGVFQEWKDIALIRKGKGDSVLSRRKSEVKALNNMRYKERTSVMNKFKAYRSAYLAKNCGFLMNEKCYKAQLEMQKMALKMNEKLQNIDQKYMTRYAYKKGIYERYSQMNDNYKMIEAQKKAAKMRDDDIFSDSGSFSVWSTQDSFHFDSQFSDPFLMDDGMSGLRSPSSLPIYR